MEQKVNEDTREVLLILQEECAEVTQAVSKCFRFGPDQMKPGKDRTNINKKKLVICLLWLNCLLI